MDCGGLENCNGSCVDTDTDPNNCGDCGDPCEVANGTPACENGICVIDSCDEGYEDCNDDPDDGCETDIANDPDNCGDCEEVCELDNASALCEQGNCVIDDCNAGYEDCNDDPDDGCEINIETDPDNCGDCEFACALGIRCGDGICGLDGVDCDGVMCDPNEVCCWDNVNGEQCVGPQQCGGQPPPVQYCDGPEDCDPTEVCCHQYTMGYAECMTTCGGLYVCTTDEWCVNNGPAGNDYCCPVMGGVFNGCVDNPCPTP
jgi:hypothetical protein